MFAARDEGAHQQSQKDCHASGAALEPGRLKSSSGTKRLQARPGQEMAVTREHLSRSLPRQATGRSIQPSVIESVNVRRASRRLIVSGSLGDVAAALFDSGKSKLKFRSFA